MFSICFFCSLLCFWKYKIAFFFSFAYIDSDINVLFCANIYSLTSQESLGYLTCSTICARSHSIALDVKSVDISSSPLGSVGLNLLLLFFFFHIRFGMRIGTKMLSYYFNNLLSWRLLCYQMREKTIWKELILTLWILCCALFFTFSLILLLHLAIEQHDSIESKLNKFRSSKHEPHKVLAVFDIKYALFWKWLRHKNASKLTQFWDPECYSSHRNVSSFVGDAEIATTKQNSKKKNAN